MKDFIKYDVFDLLYHRTIINWCGWYDTLLNWWSSWLSLWSSCSKRYYSEDSSRTPHFSDDWLIRHERQFSWNYNTSCSTYLTKSTLMTQLRKTFWTSTQYFTSRSYRTQGKDFRITLIVLFQRLLIRFRDTFSFLEISDHERIVTRMMNRFFLSSSLSEKSFSVRSVDKINWNVDHLLSVLYSVDEENRISSPLYILTMKWVFRIVCIFFVIFIISKELIISMMTLAFLSKLRFSIFIAIYIVLERASNTIVWWNRRQMKSDRIYQDEEFISIIDSIDSELKTDYSNTNHIWKRSMISRHHFFRVIFFDSLEEFRSSSTAFDVCRSGLLTDRSEVWVVW